MQILQNGTLDILMQSLFMHSSVLCIVVNGTIEIYAAQIYVTSA